MIKSKKLHNLEEMKWPDNSPMLSEADKVKAVFDVYADRWTRHFDSGEDFAQAEKIMAEHDEVMLGSPVEVDRKTLEKAKKLARLEHYGVAGQALLLLMNNKVFATALNAFISQAVGSCQLMSSIALKGWVQAKEAGRVLATKTRAILAMPWLLRRSHGQINNTTRN